MKQIETGAVSGPLDEIVKWPPVVRHRAAGKAVHAIHRTSDVLMTLCGRPTLRFSPARDRNISPHFNISVGISNQTNVVIGHQRAEG
jgi:hypothetical protein